MTPVRLTPLEQELVTALSDGKIHSIDQLFEEIDSVAYDPGTIVRTLVYTVRKKLGRDAIQRWSGRGYSLKTTVCPTCMRPLSHT